jgi:rhamnosyltransferase
MDAPDTRTLPHVLVLLATYNGAAWVDAQLEGIVSQRGVRVSVLVADDGSTDDSLARIGQWAARGAPIALLAPAPTRLGAAGNFLRLLRAAQLDGVDYVALADQDDEWPVGRLSRAVEQLAIHKALGYSSDAWAFWPDGRRRRLGKAYAQRAHDYLFEPAGPGCTYVLAAPLVLAIQRDLERQPQRFDGLGYHDWWIYAFARIHRFAWHIDPEPTVNYRQHGGNELGANFGVRGIRRRWGRLTSGWFRGQILLIGGDWPGPHKTVLEHLRRLWWRDRAWLAWHARALRRRPRDQLALAAMLLLGVLR